ncbi:hypothetical protein [Microbacterium hydrocarbonoxydans]|uniref:hypothetical protein n=1 Tax=Microbacterium hydrocarbonoxydans TaxID=273678 RepID=UPI00203F23C8|nr:hypothetical protein [Microbacterium hydrocarbonoxydans]MCM3778814.1 hypothetical protein [Microbacterium hydrocarbonoxydans]
MSRYDDDPEQADASIQQTADELNRLDDDLIAAEERAEELELQLAACEDEATQQRLEEEMEQVQRKIEDISSDREGADQAHTDNVKFWMG